MVVFIVWIVFIRLKQKINLNHIWIVAMPSGDDNTLDFIQKEKSLSTTKISKHILSDFLMSTISSFKDTENKHVYRDEDCMERFCES